MYDDGTSSRFGLQVPDLLVGVATKLKTSLCVLVGTSQRAIPLGDVAAPGWALFVNRGAAGTIYVLSGTGGAAFATLLPGEFALLRLGTSAQVPFALATQAGCELEYAIIDT